MAMTVQWFKESIFLFSFLSFSAKACGIDCLCITLILTRNGLMLAATYTNTPVVEILKIQFRKHIVILDEIDRELAIRNKHDIIKRLIYFIMHLAFITI